MGSVTVTVVGQGNIVTAAPAPKRVCRRMALSAVAGGDVSVASASALYLEHLGTSARGAQHVETPAALQGENTFMTSALKKANKDVMYEAFVRFTSLFAVSLPERYKMLSPHT